MKVSNLLIGTVFILLIIVAIVALVEVFTLYTTTNRVESAMLYSCWSAFSIESIDLDILAHRTMGIEDEVHRDIFLNKSNARDSIMLYLKDNLNLNDSLYAEDSSFINNKDYPVIVNEIKIYNPDEISSFAPNGEEIKHTSVYISLDFPITIKFVGNCYKNIELVVDSNTFYSQKQRSDNIED